MLGHPVCGNGIIEVGEQCDPPDGGVTCNANCIVPPHDCCIPHDGPGCSNQAITNAVCAYPGFEYCCVPGEGNGWDEGCVSLMVMEGYGVCGESPAGAVTTKATGYDGVGNPGAWWYPGGQEYGFNYDELDRIADLFPPGDTAVHYDYLGRRRVEKRELESPARTIRSSYVYDNVRRLIESVETLDPEGTPVELDHRGYTWDPMFNRTSRTNLLTGISHTYDYDDAGRLVHTLVGDGVNPPSRDTAYTLDGVHNRTLVTGDPDPGEYVGPYTLSPTVPEPADFQLSQYSSTPFDEREYDLNGNLVRRRAPGGSPVLAEISYDYRGQMVEYLDVSAGRRHTYSYDALGRRIRKIVDADAAPVETRYFYGGLAMEQVVEEQDGAGSTLAVYAYGNYIDGVVHMRRDTDGNGTPEDYYFHADDQFNVVAVSDASGAVVERYEYGDFGLPEFLDADWQALPYQGSSVGNPYLFTGRRYDTETGLYWYRTRYFDPVAGRFTTRDTIGLWGDPAELGNPYSYVGNRPWTWVDPYGLGLGSWIFTGQSNPPPGVYEAAKDEFAKSVSDRAHGTADAAADHFTGGLVDSVGGTTFDRANREGAKSTAQGIIEGAEYASGIPGAVKGVVKGGLKKGMRAMAGGLDDAADAARKAARGSRHPKVKAAAAEGIKRHREWDPGPGYHKEMRTPCGNRADAVHVERHHVKELKPNNARAKKRGEKQAEGYAKEFDEEYGGDWTWDVETY